MLVIEIFHWWYGQGFQAFGRKLLARLSYTADFFSIGTLLKTLFLPYRQISAGKVDGSFDTRFQAALDRLLSRFIGATLRLFLLFFGVIAIILQSVFSLIVFIAYPFIPLMPVICIVLFANGVTLP